ncbi:MAG: preprotein translocase subunit SecG [Nitrosomonas sp.]|nr:MAG: preprotein translocase subunit SecG [Nitrosomonas sp.]
METLVWVAHVILALALIILVLLQHGKGADMGAAFGSGSAGSLFGASGSATFLSRATSFTAAMFFITSMSLTYFSVNQTGDDSVMSLISEFEEATDASAEKMDEDTVLGRDLVKPGVESDSKVNQIPD